MVNNWSDNTAKWLDDNCFKNRFTKSEKFIVDRIKEAIKDLDINNVHITDFGCGTGRLIEILKKEIPEFNLKNYLGIDTSEAMLKLAKQKYPNESFLNLDSNTFPIFDNDKFDILVSLDVLQHQDKPIEFINKLISLNPDMLFIEFWSKQDGQPLNKTDNKITLSSTNESFFENVYKLSDIEKFANDSEMMLFKHDSDKDIVLLKVGLKQLNDMSDIQIDDIDDSESLTNLSDIEVVETLKKMSKKKSKKD